MLAGMLSAYLITVRRCEFQFDSRPAHTESSCVVLLTSELHRFIRLLFRLNIPNAVYFAHKEVPNFNITFCDKIVRHCQNSVKVQTYDL